MIYLYAFTKFAGSDRVFLYPHQDFAFAAGDVVNFGEDYFLVLGEEISFAEAYHFVQAKLTFTCVSAKFLSKKSLRLNTIVIIMNIGVNIFFKNLFLLLRKIQGLLMTY